MSYLTFLAAIEYAKAMIAAGDYTTDAWSFTADDSNNLLGPQGDNWTEFAKWFLGQDSAKLKTKDGYAYPYGKNGKVYTTAMNAAVSAARKAGDGSIADAAKQLLEMANEKTASKAQAARGPSDVCLVGSVAIKASASNDGAKLATFAMLAYTGGQLELEGWMHPVVIDLTGIEGVDKQRPAFRDHDPAKIVGHTTQITVTDSQITASGICSGGNAWAAEVVAAGLNGFPWQASVGAKVITNEFIPDGQTVLVNGRSFTGPVNVARRTCLGEISFVALGADDNTSARVAAKKAAKGQKAMDFEAWAKAKGFDDVSKLTGAQAESLKAMYDAETDTNDDDEKKKADAAAKALEIKASATATPAPATSTPVDPTLAIRATASIEMKRIAAVEKIAKNHPDIRAKAVDEGWTEQTTELECIKADRKAENKAHSQFNINVGAGAATGAALGLVIAAAAAMNGGVQEKYALHGMSEQEKSMVADKSLRGISLHGIMAHVAHAMGVHLKPGPIGEGDIKRLLQAERQMDIRADGSAFGGGYSTMSLSGITENILNKAMLQAYGMVPSQIDTVAFQTDTNDFKQFKRYRMTGSGNFSVVGATGELKSMSLQDESYANQVTTQGVIITVTRQILINDDMGALTQLPTVIGRKASLAREKAVWTTLLGNPNNFFGTANANYLSGGGSALSITSLTSAVQKFEEQVDADGDPIMIDPGQLLTPPAIKTSAENLFNGANLVVSALGLPSSGAQTAVLNPNAQQHVGKYTPVSVRYLAAKQALTNSSDTGWYLLPSVADVSAGFAPVQIGYLRGQRTPVIERGETNFNTLGIAMRAYFDFGVALHDPRCAVFSAGV
jgi:hypothetical protein